MSIETYSGSFTTAGTAGSATGSVDIGPVNGLLYAIYVDYGGDASTSDLTFATKKAPVKTLLTITNTNTDGWYYPRAATHDTSGAAALYAAGGAAVNDKMPVDDYITVSVAQDDPSKTITVYILVEC